MTTETSTISSPRSEVEQANPQPCDSPPKRYLVAQPKEKSTGMEPDPSKQMEEILLPAKYTPLKGYSFSRDDCAMFRMIGRGAQGEVIEAKLKDGQIDTKVVLKRSDLSLKTFDDAKGKEMKREWEMAVAIRHPNIVEFIEAFYSKENMVPKFFYLVFEKMDYDLAKYYENLEAKDLELSNRRGKRQVTRDHAFFAALATQLLKAVDYLHNIGIMHRDLKPANIGVNSKNFVVKLFDFGHSRYSATNHTHMRGTPAYNAPEVVLKLEYDTKVDIWSLGITLLGFFGCNPFLEDPKPKTVRDLFERILRITGTPKEPVHRSLKDFKQCTGITCLKDLVPLLRLSPDKGQLTEAALNQLFKEMLCFDPTERRSASQLLHGNYLSASNQKYELMNIQDQRAKNDREIFMQMMQRQSYCANSTHRMDVEAPSKAQP